MDTSSFMADVLQRSASKSTRDLNVDRRKGQDFAYVEGYVDLKRLYMLCETLIPRSAQPSADSEVKEA